MLYMFPYWTGFKGVIFRNIVERTKRHPSLGGRSCRGHSGTTEMQRGLVEPQPNERAWEEESTTAWTTAPGTLAVSKPETRNHLVLGFQGLGFRVWGFQVELLPSILHRGTSLGSAPGASPAKMNDQNYPFSEIISEGTFVLFFFCGPGGGGGGGGGSLT